METQLTSDPWSVGVAALRPDASGLKRWLDGVGSLMTRGASIIRLSQAWADVALHIAAAPRETGMYAAHVAKGWIDLARFTAGQLAPMALECPPPYARDHRFEDADWDRWPYSAVMQAFLYSEHWTFGAVDAAVGATPHNRQLARFMLNQALTAIAPCNGALGNPLVVRRVAETGGQCLVNGMMHLAEDMRRETAGLPPVGSERYRVGEDVATAPGRVIFRNELMELIQYDPTTAEVRPEPVLIVPAWIMKYYILDLSPHNSMVRWLTGQGFTVFMISWHNPDANDAGVRLEDYLELGPRAAMSVINGLTGGAKVHAAGYCLGGTLLAIEAAAQARDQHNRLASMTLFTAQTDFSEPGEIGVFIDEDQVAALDAEMAQQGYLTSSQMGAAFKALRAQDLVWAHGVNTYLLGERETLGDLMAWNTDGTRLPAAMHSEYLHKLFLRNDLAGGRFTVDRKPVSLSALAVPIFVVGTEKDHVAPWRSVFKIHRLAPAEVTFVLASGGHNAGIISEPGHAHRRFRTAMRPAGDSAPDPEAWMAHAALHEGSWWTYWGQWLTERSGAFAAPPSQGPMLAPAPGTYVLER